MTQKQLFGSVLAVAAFLIPVVAAVQAQTAPSQQQTKTQTKSVKAKQYGSEGERIFAQNCSRCHNAPEGFSPRISGTIVRHMRVRAQLSKHDEQELLRFFNP